MGFLLVLSVFQLGPALLHEALAVDDGALVRALADEALVIVCLDLEGIHLTVLGNGDQLGLGGDLRGNVRHHRIQAPFQSSVRQQPMLFRHPVAKAEPALERPEQQVAAR